jgi:hypothetical protein
VTSGGEADEAKGMGKRRRGHTPPMSLVSRWRGRGSRARVSNYWCQIDPGEQHRYPSRVDH